MTRVRKVNAPRIYQARLAKGLTQDDVAHALRRRGHDRTTAKSVYRWETGANQPRAEVIPDLAEVVDVSIGELYSADEDEEESASMALSRDEYALYGELTARIVAATQARQAAA